MKLVKGTSKAVCIECVDCGNIVLHSESYADVHSGEPMDYYCADCKASAQYIAYVECCVGECAA